MLEKRKETQPSRHLWSDKVCFGFNWQGLLEEMCETRYRYWKWVLEKWPPGDYSARFGDWFIRFIGFWMRLASKVLCSSQDEYAHCSLLFFPHAFHYLSVVIIVLILLFIVTFLEGGRGRRGWFKLFCVSYFMSCLACRNYENVRTCYFVWFWVVTVFFVYAQAESYYNVYLLCHPVSLYVYFYN